MTTILFAWELGGNLGHFTMLLPIARELRNRGHRVVFALSDLSVLTYCFEPDFDFPVLQSPRWLPKPVGLGDALAFSDILPGAGYFSEDGLKVLVAAWRQLFQLAQADIIVCEHAPTALLAARIDRRHVLGIGTGFVCPPPQSELPRFTALNNSQQLQLIARERMMLKVCNTVLAEYGHRRFLRLSDLYRNIPALLCTFPEFDHYGDRTLRHSSATYLGPIYGDVVSSIASWPRRYDQNVLVYLNNFVYWERQIAAFRMVKANIIIVALGLPAQRASEPQPEHISVITAPIALQPMLADADLMICHGGHGTVAAALMAGKPLLIWPTQKEQGLMALRLEQQRLASHSDVSQILEDVIVRQIHELLLSSQLKQSAQAFAHKHRHDSVAATVCATAENIIHRSSIE